jgi:hypothetical protein
MRKRYACLVGPLAVVILLLGLVVAIRLAFLLPYRSHLRHYPPPGNELSNADLAYLETCFHLSGLNQSRKVYCVIQPGDLFTEINVRVDAPPSAMKHIASGIWSSATSLATSESMFETELRLPEGMTPTWWDVLPLKAGDKKGDGEWEAYVLRRQKDGTMSLYAVCEIEPKDVGPALTAMINRLEPRPMEFISQGGGIYEAFWGPTAMAR